jgi:hypothetical protein
MLTYADGALEVLEQTGYQSAFLIENLEVVSKFIYCVS